MTVWFYDVFFMFLALVYGFINQLLTEGVSPCMEPGWNLPALLDSCTIYLANMDISHNKLFLEGLLENTSSRYEARYWDLFGYVWN